MVVRNGERVRQKLDHHRLPDPVLDRFAKLEDEIAELKLELTKWKKEQADDDKNL